MFKNKPVQMFFYFSGLRRISKIKNHSTKQVRVQSWVTFQSLQKKVFKRPQVFYWH